jgi:hypothetical protein
MEPDDFDDFLNSKETGSADSDDACRGCGSRVNMAMEREPDRFNISVSRPGTCNRHRECLFGAIMKEAFDAQAK